MWYTTTSMPCSHLHCTGKSAQKAENLRLRCDPVYTQAAVNAEGEEAWEEWDICTSLFDNHRSASFQANLEYMLKKFGFYLPDAQYLKDPEGLMKYLGQKIKYGRIPLYVSGDDEAAKQFRSLHAVQRHMVDRNQCKVKAVWVCCL